MERGIGGEDAFEPAAMRLASKVLLGMEWLLSPDRPEADASY
jgi:hypothetical protein